MSFYNQKNQKNKKITQKILCKESEADAAVTTESLYLVKFKYVYTYAANYAKY